MKLAYYNNTCLLYAHPAGTRITMPRFPPKTALVERFQETFREQIGKFFDVYAVKWGNDAQGLIDQWQNEYNWPQFRSWVAHGGKHKTKRKACVNWNAQLTWQIRSCLLPFGFPILEEEMDEGFKEFRDSLVIMIREMRNSVQADSDFEDNFFKLHWAEKTIISKLDQTIDSLKKITHERIRKKRDEIESTDETSLISKLIKSRYELLIKTRSGETRKCLSYYSTEERRESIESDITTGKLYRAYGDDLELWAEWMSGSLSGDLDRVLEDIISCPPPSASSTMQ